MLTVRRGGCVVSLATTVMIALSTSCGGGGSGGGQPLGDDGGGPSDDASNGSDSPSSGDGGSNKDSGGPGTDSGMAGDSGGGWNGMFTGPLTCSGTGNYKMNFNGTCGVERWPVKTGTDNGAGGLSLLPTLTTIASLITIPMPGGTLSYTVRYAPAEKQVVALKDVQLIFARLEGDGDYHLVISDGTSTMITEVPFPGCFNGGAWACPISRARASVDAALPNLQPLMGKVQHSTVSVIGVGFWDPEHGQYGVAPNNLELHPLLAICFGAGCDPTKD